MEQQPLVSVIINCYNGEKYLREAIDSVIAQTYTNWELIFWDNQSTDSTADIVKSYKNERIRYFYAQEHTPLGEARNLAMKEAKGKYLAFLDADDVWLSHRLKVCVTKIIEDTSIGLIYVDYQPFGDSNIKSTSYEGGYRSLNSLLERYDIGMSCALMPVDLIRLHNICFKSNYQLIEDLDFFISICRISKCYHVKDIMVKYRISSDSLSYQLNTWHIEISDFLQKLIRSLSKEQKKECKSGLNCIEQRYKNRVFLDYYYSGKRIKSLISLGETNYSISQKMIFIPKIIIGFPMISKIKSLM